MIPEEIKVSKNNNCIIDGIINVIKILFYKYN